MFTPNKPWYFDGYNILHAVLLGRERDVTWWHRDFQQLVVSWAETLILQSPIDGAPITVVFDAQRPVAASETVNSAVLSVIYAPSADEWIVDTCRRTPGAHVVSADRSLTDRAKAAGAVIFKPWAFENGPTSTE
jgi:predicted RNA-binding protein with PIN domain